MKFFTVMILTGLFLSGTAFAKVFTTIKISTDGTMATVLIDGFGTDEIGKKFRKDIKRMPTSVKVLRFNRDNLGGRTPYAWDIAEVIRERGITTYVNDAYCCASMCTLIYLSGTERVATAGATFMIHAVRGDGRNPASTTKVNSYVGSLYKQYGLSEQLAEKIFITDEHTRSDHHYSAREAQKIGLVTSVR